MIDAVTTKEEAFALIEEGLEWKRTLTDDGFAVLAGSGSDYDPGDISYYDALIMDDLLAVVHPDLPFALRALHAERARTYGDAAVLGGLTVRATLAHWAAPLCLVDAAGAVYFACALTDLDAVSEPGKVRAWGLLYDVAQLSLPGDPRSWACAVKAGYDWCVLSVENLDACAPGWRERWAAAKALDYYRAFTADFVCRPAASAPPVVPAPTLPEMGLD